MLRKRVDIVLVEREFFPSRAKAREAIDAGLVAVQGRVLQKPSEMIEEDAAIEARKPYPWVSRGGVKLAAALDAFAIDPSGLACVDIGASTGGFTHVLLERGAASVVAVDVGHSQIDPSIAADPRVTSIEKCDARALSRDHLASPPALAVFDVSFISLAAIMPAVLPLLAPDAALVALIKPQFEAGRGNVVKGIVRDQSIRQAACDKIRDALATAGWSIAGIIPSPIEGGDGNREFLIGARRCAAAEGAS